MGSDAARVVILGGGVAGVEAMLALADLAPDRVEVEIVAPDPEFTLKPTAVEEPFLLKPPERRDLRAAAAEAGASFALGAATRIAPRRRRVELADRSHLHYDYLVVALGARTRTALPSAETFWASRSDLPIDALIDRAAASASHALALIVPPGSVWTLPLYELALQARTRAARLGHADLAVDIYTPEPSPLTLFGTTASHEVGTLLAGRDIGFLGNVTVLEDERGAISVHPGGAPLDAGVAIAIPALSGPRMPGLPTDADGFIPIDESCRVVGADRIYAAGDGTNFPVKQGGIATQQADAAAESIAQAVGAAIDPAPFHPVLRGQLILGEESLYMRHDLTGGHGEGTASPDYLWWPPGKISGRYLTPWLYGEGGPAALEAPARTLDVEVALGDGHHLRPMAMGSHPNPV